MGVMQHVGILGSDKKLTDTAKKKFIQEVKDVLRYGTEGLPPDKKPAFPCGGPLPPAGEDVAKALDDLEDEKKFQDFHKNILGMYENIANSLDADGNFNLLPAIADPIAVAGKLGANIEPPDFPAGFVPYFTGNLVTKLSEDLVKAGKVEFTLPPKLASKLPALVGVPKPPTFQLPPKMVIPPSAVIVPPTADVSPCLARVPPSTPQNALFTLAAIQTSVATGTPKLVAQVIAKIPSIVAKLANINDAVGEICGLVRDSGLFGQVAPTSVTQQAATIVLSRKTSECIMLNALASTVGSAPGSATTGVTKKTTLPEGYAPITAAPADKAPPPKKLPQTEKEILEYYPATTTGIALLEGLSDEPSVRSAQILSLVVQGKASMPRATIETQIGNSILARIQVSAKAMTIEGVRVSVNQKDLQHIADYYGGHIMTRRLTEIINLQADVWIEPQSQEMYSKDKSLGRLFRVFDYDEVIKRALTVGEGEIYDESNGQRRFRGRAFGKITKEKVGNLYANEGKDWIIDSNLFLPGKNSNGIDWKETSTNHGWYQNRNPNKVSGIVGDPIQYVGHKHDILHVDYSQLARIVFSVIEVSRDGGETYEQELYSNILENPTLRELVADEKGIKSDRHPGVPRVLKTALDKDAYKFV